jgi:hypothetical protein
MTINSENPDAGQGPVLLDIGGDVGALVVTMPAQTEGLEVEIRPKGATALKVGGAVADPHDHGHRHGHRHTHDAGAGHDHGHLPFPHVAVVGRRAPGGLHHCLVFPSLAAGDYELCPIPGDDIVLTATVVGGEVTQLVPTEPMLGPPWRGWPPESTC